MLKPGDAAPNFPLPADPSNPDAPATLHALLQQGPAIVYFYPADFTPLCTAQACMFRDVHHELAELGLRTVGISTQNEQSHDKFRDKHTLPFTLIADTDKAIVKAWGVTGPLGLGTRRATFLINPDATIEDRTVGDLSLAKHKAFIQNIRERFARQTNDGADA
ncbi:MAG: peroxiredoxin [Phycisphaerales bacterium]|nr:MAG: peroxiredoxin [Phycisphaerales bacterium]